MKNRRSSVAEDIMPATNNLFGTPSRSTDNGEIKLSFVADITPSFIQNDQNNGYYDYNYD